MDFAVKPTLPINLAGAVDINGTVPVTGAVGVTGNVPVIGPLTSQSVASGASSTAVVTATNGSNTPLTTTIIAGSARQLELHSCTATFVQSGGASPAPNVGRLIRSDTGADIMTPFGLGVVLPVGTYVQQKDFEGARLPAFVAVQSIIVQEGFGPTGTLTVDFNYNVVG